MRIVNPLLRMLDIGSPRFPYNPHYSDFWIIRQMVCNLPIYILFLIALRRSHTHTRGYIYIYPIFFIYISKFLKFLSYTCYIYLLAVQLSIRQNAKSTCVTYFKGLVIFFEMPSDHSLGICLRLTSDVLWPIPYKDKIFPCRKC